VATCVISPLKVAWFWAVLKVIWFGPFLSSGVTKPKQSLRNYVMSLGLLKCLRIGSRGQLNRYFTMSILTRRDYQRVYHEMPSRQTVWNIVNKFRQNGYTISFSGDKGTGLHPETIRRCSWNKTNQRMIAMRFEETPTFWTNWPQHRELFDPAYNAASTSVVDCWSVDVFEPPRRITEFCVQQREKNITKKELLVM
jgi:hypothetical protein